MKDELEAEDAVVLFEAKKKNENGIGEQRISKIEEVVGIEGSQ